MKDSTDNLLSTNPKRSRKIKFPKIRDYKYGSGEHNFFKFKDIFLSDLKTLIDIAQRKSPEATAYFLIDFQFGSKRSKFIQLDTLPSLWKLHDEIGLRFNTLYIIKSF